MRLPVTLLLGLLGLLALGLLALAGCGSSGGPPIDRAVGIRLADRADAVAAAENPCTARDRAVTLQRQTIGAINAGHIPQEYLEVLQSRVTEIVTELEVRCLPALAPQSTRPATAEPERAPDVAEGRGGSKHDHKHDGKRDAKGHGHGKHGR